MEGVVTMGTVVQSASSSTVLVTDLSWKPLGRGRRFDRMRRGLARRMRIPFVRKVLWERDNPQSFSPRSEPTYGQPWNSANALADFSFACRCHKGERYNRRRGR